MTLSKIYSFAKKQQIINAIKEITESINNDERHKKRLYVIGFLSYCGYSDTEIKNILEYYNSKLINTRYSNISFIRADVLNYSNNKKDVEEEKPSHNNIAKRSEANIPFNLNEITLFRYNQIPNDDLNKQFFKGANIIAYGYKDNLGLEHYNLYSNKFYPVYNPKQRPYYRSISGVDHVLFVADLDKGNFNNSFELLLEYAKELNSKWDWDIIKFSGSEGIHLIKYLPKETTLKDLREKALEFDSECNKLDWHMFNDLNWKIRGYCVNWKTGLLSRDIDLINFNYGGINNV